MAVLVADMSLSALNEIRTPFSRTSGSSETVPSIVISVPSRAVNSGSPTRTALFIRNIPLANAISATERMMSGFFVRSIYEKRNPATARSAVKPTTEDPRRKNERTKTPERNPMITAHPVVKFRLVFTSSIHSSYK